MSLKYLIKEETLKNMADTIRSKMGTTEPMNTVEMVEAIANIPSSTEMTNATATEDKVLEGYTFYAGEGGLKTGNVSVGTATPSDVVLGKTYYGNTGTLSGIGTAVHLRSASTSATATSEVVHLPAGTYKYNYLSTLYTYPSSYGCNLTIYANGSSVFSYSSLSRYSEFLGNLYIFWGSTSGTITLDEDADVYMKLTMTLDQAYIQLSQASAYLTRVN